MVARILALFAFMLSVPALAQDDAAASLQGSWALKIGAATIFRFDMSPVEGKPGEWKGEWIRPRSFATDGNSFSNLTLPARSTPSMAGLEFDGEVELSFNDPRPGAIPDIFRFRLIDGQTATMEYVGTDLLPYSMVRVETGAPLGPYESGAIYQRIAGLQPGQPGADSTGPDALDEGLDSFRLPPSGTPTR